MAATAAGLRCYDEWFDLPYDLRLSIVAEYEITWRIEALQAWEQRPKTKKIHGRKRS